MKSVIMDSSSAILLLKCGVLSEVINNYSSAVPCRVMSELTLSGYEGSEFFSEQCMKEKIKVYAPSGGTGKNINRSLHEGEREAVSLFYEGKGDFVLIDDGRGSAFCRDNKIPYINALLAVKIIFIKNLISEETYNEAWEWLLANGRYSQGIIEWAENADEHSLEYFI